MSNLRILRFRSRLTTWNLSEIREKNAFSGTSGSATLKPLAAWIPARNAINSRHRFARPKQTWHGKHEIFSKFKLIKFQLLTQNDKKDDHMITHMNESIMI